MRPSHGNMKLAARRQGGAKTLPYTVVCRLVCLPPGGGKHARASRYLVAALIFAWGNTTSVYEIASLPLTDIIMNNLQVTHPSMSKVQQNKGDQVISWNETLSCSIDSRLLHFSLACRYLIAHLLYMHNTF